MHYHVDEQWILSIETLQKGWAGIPKVKRQERETYVGWINLTKEDECVGIGSLTVHLHKLTATGNLVGRLHQHLHNASRRQEP